MLKHVLMIVSKFANGITATSEGISAAELIHPYDVFRMANCKVTIASSRGGAVVFKPLRDPSDLSGASNLDPLSARYIAQPRFIKRLMNTPAISELNISDYDAIFVCGGEGTLYTKASGLSYTKASGLSYTKASGLGIQDHFLQ
ncbi:hypothetical protein AM10699_57400 (plasmid) [Acaryochloris marina MBIC10699]|nr:hypothetical protein AM10699_57400 [Acaryochloris marina MBIC10699]